MEGNGKIKIDATLFDLCLGIFLYGIVCQIIILFFSKRPEYSIGLWIGVILGIAGSVHMWWTIDRSLDMISKDASKTAGAHYLIRYGTSDAFLTALLAAIQNPIITIITIRTQT